MKIAILGTRGIPNEYGGFEQFAENLSNGLKLRGYNITVYNTHFHPFKEKYYNGINIIRKWCPEKILGSSAHFIYDFLCLNDAIKRNFDIILELGYGTSSISYYLCNINKSIIITNMDGMEWRRDKWNTFTKILTKWFEKIGAIKSHYLVSDNIEIKNYLYKTYKKTSVFIPYGANIFLDAEESILDKFNIKKYQYYLLVARLEPENNIEIVLNGFAKTSDRSSFIVIGNNNTKYGKYLVDKFSFDKRIKFIGGLYNMKLLNNLRYYAKIYFHGHSVGGTNPSLLEAMASNAFICAHNNKYNRSVLGSQSLYFSNEIEVSNIINKYNILYKTKANQIIENLVKIKNIYNWGKITEQYSELFKKAINGNCINNSI